MIDLTGCEVVDIGAGTGRSAIEAAKKAKKVFAVDLYESVVSFGKNQLQLNKTTNVQYIIGNRDQIPLQANQVDVAINAWAELNLQEAYRVLKPNGFLIQLGSVPNALCGELTSVLGPDYPWVLKDYASLEVFERYPETIVLLTTPSGMDYQLQVQSMSVNLLMWRITRITAKPLPSLDACMDQKQNTIF
jgi:ubiquinone/menaquinone biosynthesis C-methylase UbiE